MCKWGTTVPVHVKLLGGEHEGTTWKTEWRDFAIDSCIAPLVDALQKAGVDMRASCCGHGKADGYIWLADGRMLIITTKENAADYFGWEG